MTANGGRRSPASRACHSASLRLVTASRSTGASLAGRCCRAEESRSLVVACVGTLVSEPRCWDASWGQRSGECELVARASRAGPTTSAGSRSNPNRRPGPGAANCTQTLPRVLSVAPGREGIPSRDHAQRCAFLHRTTPRGKRRPAAHSTVAPARRVTRSPTSGHPAGTGSGYSMSKAIGSSRRPRRRAARWLRRQLTSGPTGRPGADVEPSTARAVLGALLAIGVAPDRGRWRGRGWCSVSVCESRRRVALAGRSDRVADGLSTRGAARGARGQTALCCSVAWRLSRKWVRKA